MAALDESVASLTVALKLARETATLELKVQVTMSVGVAKPVAWINARLIEVGFERLPVNMTPAIAESSVQSGMFSDATSKKPLEPVKSTLKSSAATSPTLLSMDKPTL